MKRIFGVGGKPKAPAPTIADTTAALEKRGESWDVKIAKIDKELAMYKEQLKKTRPGPSQTRIKQKALHLLKQKRLYEQQRGAISNQQFSLDQMAFTAEMTKTTLDQVACMKDAAKSMKQQMKQLNIGKIEDMQDEIEDLFYDAQEIQDIMGRTYGVPEDVDEDDLEAELAALGDEMVGDASYLDEALGGPVAPTGVRPQPLPAQQDTTTDPERLEQQLGL